MLERTLPSRSQLLLPILETLQEMGGQAAADKVINQVNERLHIPSAVSENYRQVDCGSWGKRQRCSWRQTLHWVRLDAVHAGLLERVENGYWTVSRKGTDSLHNCQPGAILLVYETPSGQAIWADAITAAGAMADNSIQLLFTSPPYPLAGVGRKYGNLKPDQTVKMIVDCAKEWRRALTDDGSIVINLRDCFLPKAETGGAVRSIYQEQILVSLVQDAKLFFADRFYWKNPAHAPDNAWVTVHRVRTNLDVENIFWLSKSPNPRADNRNVLVDAAPATIATYLRKARKNSTNRIGPSGNKNLFEEQIASVAAGQSIKVIPRNLIEASNSDTQRSLKELLEKLHLPRHDAIMPLKLAEFFIKFLTSVGDTVADPFHGSGTIALAAERLGRKWIGSDRSLAHVVASAIRLREFNPQFQPS
jgi:site-specific DNA-methyltransferase (cytosine-N4-specific)